MRVLLINPPSTGVYSVFGVNLPPMGLLYLAACLEREGHEVRVKDLQVEPAGLTADDLRRADLVGITSDTTRIEKAQKIAAWAASLGKPVVMGGPHPQFVADAILRDGSVKFIVKGEGEISLTRLAAEIGCNGDPSGVSGIIFRDGDRIVDTGKPIPPDVELLPFPARHLVDLKRYSATMSGIPLTPVVTSRGCPGGCSFCSSSSFFGRGWRSRSPESVLAELEEVCHRHGYRGIAFVDDNFSLDPERVVDICSGIRARGLDIKFWNFSRIDTIVRNPAMVQAMAAAGSTVVYLGIESAGADTLATLGKRGQAGETEAAVSLLQDNGIEVYGSYIIGHLNERRADVERTIDLAVRLNTNTAQFSILTPYPGTALYEQVKDRIFVKRWKFYDALHLVFRHPHINRHLLQLLLFKAYIRFYRRSQKAVADFKEYRQHQEVSLRKILTCAYDLFF